MTNIPSGRLTDGTPTYTGGGARAGRFTDYYPAWIDNLADDVTVEGSMMDGVAVGPEALRTIVGTIRTLYGDSQAFHFAAWEEPELFTTEIRAAFQTQR